MAKLILIDNQECDLSVSFVDAAGNPAQVDGAPTWDTSDESIITVTPAEGGLSAVVSAAGPLGVAQVHVAADAIVGEGIEEIVGTLDVEIVAGKAVSIAIATGTPRDKA